MTTIRQYGPTKLDNRLSQNVKDIRRSHEVYREFLGKLESETDTMRKKFVKVKIHRGIFQGNALSSLIFVLAMLQLKHIFRKCTGGYKFHKSGEKNQPSNIHERHKTAKNYKDLVTLIQTARMYSEDIEMEFGIEKFTILIMKSRKRDWTEGIELPN